jgi:acylphosphatase
VLDCGTGGNAMGTGREVAFSVRVTGHVQGVAYRAWCRAEARALGLRGWVRNRGDGSVEAVVAGPEDDVTAMLAAMSEGPGAARVTDVWTGPADPAEVKPGFDIRA